eukprot:Rhum_TRINITY_DN22973_c0_g1::Rhum_TRINITY_DN22973_c0_g1_i1::g.176684::m.176684
MTRDSSNASVARRPSFLARTFAQSEDAQVELEPVAVASDLSQAQSDVADLREFSKIGSWAPGTPARPEDAKPSSPDDAAATTAGAPAGAAPTTAAAATAGTTGGDKTSKGLEADETEASEAAGLSDDEGGGGSTPDQYLTQAKLDRHDEERMRRFPKERQQANIDVSSYAHYILVNHNNIKMWRTEVVQAPKPLTRPSTADALEAVVSAVSASPVSYEDVASPQINFGDGAVNETKTVKPWLELNDKANFMMVSPPREAGMIHTTVRMDGNRVVMRLGSNNSFLAHSWAERGSCCTPGGTTTISIGPEDMDFAQFVSYKLCEEGAGMWSPPTSLSLRSEHDRFAATVTRYRPGLETTSVPAAAEKKCRVLGSQLRCKACVKSRVSLVKASTEPVQDSSSLVSSRNPPGGGTAPQYQAPAGAVCFYVPEAGAGKGKGAQAPCLVIHSDEKRPLVQHLVFSHPLCGLEAFAHVLSMRIFQSSK